MPNLGISDTKFYRVVSLYNQQGASFCAALKWVGRTYSPELNPTEHLWDYIREHKGFNNHSFESRDELENHLEDILKKSPPTTRKSYLQSLCTFNWMTNTS